MSLKYIKINTPIGELLIESDNELITSIKFRGGFTPENIVYSESPVLLQAKQEIAEYFSGERRTFSVPVKIQGAAFSKAVYNALIDIPYGKTMYYGELAEKLGNPKAARAVGNANNKNPLPIIVPCHRVIGKDGSLTGFRGGLDAKRYLLEMEKEFIMD